MIEGSHRGYLAALEPEDNSAPMADEMAQWVAAIDAALDHIKAGHTHKARLVLEALKGETA